MKSIYELKTAFQNLLRPLTIVLARIGFTANHITFLALFMSLATGVIIAIYPENNEFLLIIPCILFLRMALNAIDGMLAREHNMQSAFGAVINELGDVLSDLFIYLPFALIIGLSPFLVVIFVFLAILTEMTGVVAVQIGASRRYDGPMGKSDRAFVIGLVALLIGLGVEVGEWISLVFWIMIILSILTVVNRINKALKELKNEFNK